MPYTALPDRRIPYDNDGTVVGWYHGVNGLTAYPSGADLISLNGSSYAAVNTSGLMSSGTMGVLLFFPEQREVTGIYAWLWDDGGAGFEAPITGLVGSTDTTNGQDGTWETASLPGGVPGKVNSYAWRSDIKAVSFTGGKRTVRIYRSIGYDGLPRFFALHLYGEKTAGQTPDDVIYIDHDTTPGVEYAAPEDFGDQPLGTTVVRQFRLKNTSATKTANSINVQCNDADFAISTDGVTWVVTINIASLGPGAQSATMYVRCTTPPPGNLLGPRFARIVTTVASYT